MDLGEYSPRRGFTKRGANNCLSVGLQKLQNRAATIIMESSYDANAEDPWMGQGFCKPNKTELRNPLTLKRFRKGINVLNFSTDTPT